MCEIRGSWNRRYFRQNQAGIKHIHENPSVIASKQVNTAQNWMMAIKRVDQAVERIAVKRVGYVTWSAAFVYVTQRVEPMPIVSSVNIALKDSVPMDVDSMIQKRALETKRAYPEHAIPILENVPARWCAATLTMRVH